MSYPKWDPHRGKWTIRKRLKSILKANGREMPVEDLLNRMSRQGYLKEPLRRQLEILDIEVIDGVARLIG